MKHSSANQTMSNIPVGFPRPGIRNSNRSHEGQSRASHFLSRHDSNYVITNRRRIAWWRLANNSTHIMTPGVVH